MGTNPTSADALRLPWLLRLVRGGDSSSRSVERNWLRHLRIWRLSDGIEGRSDPALGPACRDFYSGTRRDPGPGLIVYHACNDLAPFRKAM
jgi:hypothetical protein